MELLPMETLNTQHTQIGVLDFGKYVEDAFS
jgi:hypothetical protein